MGQRLLGVGDRVAFLHDHPWHGYAGTVTESMSTSFAEGWVVEVDGCAGLTSFATDREIRLLDKGNRPKEGD